MNALVGPKPLALVVVAALVVLVALGATRPTLAVAEVPGEVARAPATLAETGLFASGLELAPGVRPFAPQYPLWTDGAHKRRWIALPPGATIDVSDPDRWELPVGTRLWKEFAFDGRKVETRFIWRVDATRWLFATYLWNEAQDAAALAPEDGMRGMAPLGSGRAHDVPGLDDCEACHRTGPNVVLGFGALQLSDDRDPMAPHAESLTPDMITLRTLVEEELVSPHRPEWIDAPPRIMGRTPRERAALGYLAANCGGCHDARGALAHVGLDLAHASAAPPGEPPRGLATTVDAPGRWLVPGVPPEGSRVVAPGDPARSALYQRMRSRRPLSQMPPLGTALPDAEALALIQAWITHDLAPAPKSP
ncbi:MAG: hypothetical protein IT385_12700 [Deltaproteobacteria bacterium]|nr:hypothetical protein [Deltaproteobacteria bacterium]